VGLVFRSIGYKGVAIPGVPFDDRAGIIPNVTGRVINGEQMVIGEYVVGWIKRGPSGIIGTNKPDAQETADRMLEDLAAGKTLTPSDPMPEGITTLLQNRKIEFVTFADWQILDRLELERGQARNRLRVKFTSNEEMLQALHDAKNGTKMAAD
jgi:ferredoxin--NADP+ reductase